MVVRLILEIDQPLFFHAVYFDRHNNTACIDLIGFFLIFQFSLFFQLPHCHQRKIHQADKLVFSSGKNLTVRPQILFVCIFNRFSVIPVSKPHILQFSGKCRMTAVIGPVSIQHTDFRH